MSDAEAKVVSATKKPITIEAAHFTSRDEAAAIAQWCGGVVVPMLFGFVEIKIQTLEGAMWAREGDWIIRGVQGEFYPCKPDIFDETYDVADES